MQSRVEELEIYKDSSKMKNKTSQEVKIIYKNLKQFSKVKGNVDLKEVELIKSENCNLKLLIKSYEERNNIISELEKKLHLQQMKYEKELRDLGLSYKDKIKGYLSISINNKVNTKDKDSKKILKDENLSRNIINSSKIDNQDKLETKTTASIFSNNVKYFYKFSKFIIERHL